MTITEERFISEHGAAARQAYEGIAPDLGDCDIEDATDCLISGDVVAGELQGEALKAWRSLSLNEQSCIILASLEGYFA